MSRIQKHEKGLNGHQLINTLDTEKKKNFKNRTLISIFVVLFYVILVVFAFLSDSGQTKADWLKGIIDSSTIKGIFALLFVFLLYVPFICAIKEALRLVFREYQKIPIITLMILSSIFYLAPSLFLIGTTYYSRFIVEDTSNTNANLFFVYFLYLTIFFSSVIILITVNVFLNKYKIMNFKNGFTISFLLILIPFGFLGFALIGILRGWTTILFVLIAVISTDAMCYIFGMLFGKHKMAKVISPNKTWEGAIIGTTVSVALLLVYCALLWLDTTQINIAESISGTSFEGNFEIIINRGLINLWNISQFQTKIAVDNPWALWIILFFISIGLVVISILGDLLFSFIKRKFEIKDFGTALKSHGGFLDRFDSFIVTSSVYFIYSSMILGIFAISKNVDIFFGKPIF